MSDDVLLRITYADSRPTVVGWSSAERAERLLRRYNLRAWYAGAFALVQKVEMGPVKTHLS